jgi:hypothetical protein
MQSSSKFDRLRSPERGGVKSECIFFVISPTVLDRLVICLARPLAILRTSSISLASGTEGSGQLP